jgi:hypothetical protein
MWVLCGAVMKNQFQNNFLHTHPNHNRIVGGQYIAPLQGKVFAFLSTSIFICFLQTTLACSLPNQNNVSALLYLEKNKNEYRIKQRIQKTNQYLPLFFQALGKPLQTF